MERIKQFITEWNAIIVVYLILVAFMIGQMIYIYKIKSELKLFQDKQNENISSTGNNRK